MSAQNADARRTLSGALARLGRADESIEHLEEAVRLRPYAWRDQYALARALMIVGRHEQAIRSVRESLMLKPDRPGLQVTLKESLVQSAAESAR